jgi:AcrR family transcriptional regulator
MAEKSSGGKKTGKPGGSGGRRASAKASGRPKTKASPRGTSGAKGGRGGARKKADPSRAILNAALALAAERGWKDLSLFEIAQASGQPMSTVYEIFPSKTAILAGFLRDIEEKAIGDVTPEEFEPGESARDRLFDLVMRGFDALVPHKKAVGEIVYDVMRDPIAAAAALPHFARTMARTLETAGISSSGLRGLVRVKGLMAICLGTLRSFLRDDTVDMAKTMATLDGYLRRVESVARSLNARRRRDGDESAEPESA